MKLRDIFFIVPCLFSVFSPEVGAKDPKGFPLPTNADASRSTPVHPAAADALTPPPTVSVPKAFQGFWMGAPHAYNPSQGVSLGAGGMGIQERKDSEKKGQK